MAHSRKTDPKARNDATSGQARTDSRGIREDIEVGAYYRYCERGFADGDDIADWLAAEQEIRATRPDAESPTVPPGDSGTEHR